MIKKVLPRKKDFLILKNKKAVDIILCKNGRKPALYFIEIKYHKSSHGRLGTGHGKGGAIQPEILKYQPDYFKNNMRWILGSENKDGFWIMDNTTISSYIAGKEIGEKYNNIQTRIFDDSKSLSETKLIQSLRSWLV